MLVKILCDLLDIKEINAIDLFTQKFMIVAQKLTKQKQHTNDQKH